MVAESPPAPVLVLVSSPFAAATAFCLLVIRISALKFPLIAVLVPDVINIGRPLAAAPYMILIKLGLEIPPLVSPRNWIS